MIGLVYGLLFFFERTTRFHLSFLEIPVNHVLTKAPNRPPPITYTLHRVYLPHSLPFTDPPSAECSPVDFTPPTSAACISFNFLRPFNTYLLRLGHCTRLLRSLHTYNT